MSALLPFQQQFLECALQNEVLRFGEFTLKSGRHSPYFFNLGCIANGHALAQVGECYAQAIKHHTLDYDVIFGPAYKGITIAASTAIAFAHRYQETIAYAFNRKEVKDHGEGGQIVGSVAGRVLIVDDVLTAGTALTQAIGLIQSLGAEVVGVMIGFDRHECAPDSKISAAQKIRDQYQIPVHAVANALDLLNYVAHQLMYKQYLPSIESYLKQYGVS